MLIVSMMTGVLTLLIVMTLAGRMNHAAELDSQMSSVVENTIITAMKRTDGDCFDRQQLLAFAIGQSASMLETKADIAVKIYGADAQKGILGMDITEQYKHPNQKNGKVNRSRTVIFSPLLQQEEEILQVYFFLSGEDMIQNRNCFKKIQVLKGERIFTPATPRQTGGGSFDGWVDVNGYLADFSQPVTDNLVYYARWN